MRKQKCVLWDHSLRAMLSSRQGRRIISLRGWADLATRSSSMLTVLLNFEDRTTVLVRGRFVRALFNSHYGIKAYNILSIGKRDELNSHVFYTLLLWFLTSLEISPLIVGFKNLFSNEVNKRIPAPRSFSLFVCSMTTWMALTQRLLCWRRAADRCGVFCATWSIRYEASRRH